MKQNFKISINNLNETYSIAIVKGELIPLVKGIKTFIHKDYENPNIWVISELTTGYKIVSKGIREEVIQEAKRILTEKREKIIKLIKNVNKEDKKIKQDFKIRVYDLDGNYSITIVKGKLVFLVEGIDTFIYKCNKNKGWAVSELLSGLRITHYKETQKEALKEAKEILLERKKEAIEIIKNLVNKEGALNIKKEV